MGTCKILACNGRDGSLVPSQRSYAELLRGRRESLGTRLMDEVVVISSESCTESDDELNLHSYEATTIRRSVQNDTLRICECREVNWPV